METGLRPVAVGDWTALAGRNRTLDPTKREKTSVDAIINYFNSWTGIIINSVILLGLIGLLLYMRNKQSEE
jgi:hypothetical protein